MTQRLLTLLVVMWLCAVHVVVAQHGIITYEERVELDIQLPPEMQHMAGNFPTEVTSQQQLFFNGTRSIMRATPKEEEQLERPNRSGGFIVFQAGSGQNEDVFFADRDENVYLQRRDMFGRTFLIEDTVQVLPWRLTGQQATFLGYLTMQAIAQTSDTTSVEAWFTPEIPAPVGPHHYGGLPGAILVVTDGPRSLVATSVEADEPAESILQPPSDGRRVSPDEFEILIEERARQFGAPVRSRRR